MDDLKYDTLYQRFISFFVKLVRKIPLPGFIRKFVKYDIFSYIFIGGLTTLVNFVIYFPVLYLLNLINPDSQNIIARFINWICTVFPNSNYDAMLTVIATTVAWIGAVLFAFFPNKTAVFENHDMSAGTVLKEMGGFFLSRIFSLIAEAVIIYLFTDLMGWNSVIIKIIASIVVLILNFVFSKFFVFKNKSSSKEIRNE